jgi:hypothetical protein
MSVRNVQQILRDVPGMIAARSPISDATGQVPSRQGCGGVSHY